MVIGDRDRVGDEDGQVVRSDAVGMSFDRKGFTHGGRATGCVGGIDGGVDVARRWPVAPRLYTCVVQTWRNCTKLAQLPLECSVSGATAQIWRNYHWDVQIWRKF